MKKLLFLILVIIPLMAIADTKTITWYNGDSVYDTTTCTIGNDLILPATPTKYGHTFQGWRDYKAIEYLESTGTQYIDTGIKPSEYNGLQYEGYMSPVSVVGQYNAVCGTENPRMFWPMFLNNMLQHFGIGNSWATQLSPALEQGVKYKFFAKAVLEDFVFELNDTVWRYGSATGTYSTKPMFLFAANNGSTALYNSAIKLYSFKIWDGTKTNLLADFAPALDPNNVPCMYDKVSKTYFYNAGTGSFIAGPAI